MSIRAAVLSQMVRVAQQQDKQLTPLTDDVRLLDSGLDSLCIAIVVASLDDQLNLDPFSTGEDVGFPVTIGDFVKLYENAA